ncbi:MAG: hypothetical protein LQ346_007454 [Caloplaca aetnensis]|nr:MAG: hypothetical protein LQ346_007454 [Caloplaca aetnensis]
MSDFSLGLSAMDLDNAASDREPPQTVTHNMTHNIRSPDLWQSLTAQALSNRTSTFRAGTTQAEHRKLLQQRRFEKRDNRLYEIAYDEKAKPVKRKDAIDTLRKMGKLSKDEAKKLGKPRLKLSTSSKISKQQILSRKAKATIKASGVARTKALERAIENLDLSGAQPAESASRQPLLSLAHVEHILSGSSMADSFSHFLECQKDPSFAAQISPKDQRRLTALQRVERSLQTRARQAGSIEAALAYQDERVAYFDELKALREQDSLLNDQRSYDLETSSFKDGGDYPIKCICGFQQDDGNMVLCEHCITWQHVECYYFVGVGETPDLNGSRQHCVDCKPRWLDTRGAIERQKSRREKALVGSRGVVTRSKQREAQELMRNHIVEKDRLRQVNDVQVQPKLYDSYRPAQETLNTAPSRQSRRNSAPFTPLLGGRDYYHARPSQAPLTHNHPPYDPDHRGGPRLIDSYRPVYDTKQPPIEPVRRERMFSAKGKPGGSS